jgi:hypothetical protein
MLRVSREIARPLPSIEDSIKPTIDFELTGDPVPINVLPAMAPLQLWVQVETIKVPFVTLVVRPDSKYLQNPLQVNVSHSDGCSV